MEARTIAVQVSEQLFTRLKNVVAWKGCKQKEFLISVIEKAIEEAEAEMEKAAAGSYRTVSQMSGRGTPGGIDRKLKRKMDEKNSRAKA